jgi:hypothetical protein
MAKITVKLDGKSLFNWEGDADAIKNIETDFEAVSAHEKLSPDVFASNAVRHLPSMPLQKADPATSQMQMMAILYFLFSRDTGHPDHPGKYRDYAAAWDFEFDISCLSDGNQITIGVNGTSGPWA